VRLGVAEGARLRLQLRRRAHGLPAKKKRVRSQLSVAAVVVEGAGGLCDSEQTMSVPRMPCSTARLWTRAEGVEGAENGALLPLRALQPWQQSLLMLRLPQPQPLLSRQPLPLQSQAGHCLLLLAAACSAKRAAWGFLAARSPEGCSVDLGLKLFG
jgi:hypothetical protein